MQSISTLRELGDIIVLVRNAEIILIHKDSEREIASLTFDSAWSEDDSGELQELDGFYVKFDTPPEFEAGCNTAYIQLD